MIEKVQVEYLDKKDSFRLSNGKSADTLNPKELLMYAAVCCAGKTVTGIFGKQRVKPKKLELTMYGDLDTADLTAQSIYTAFRIVYYAECDSEVDRIKMNDAIKIADEKYCGTLKMMRRIAPVKREINVVNTETVNA